MNGRRENVNKDFIFIRGLVVIAAALIAYLVVRPDNDAPAAPAARPSVTSLSDTEAAGAPRRGRRSPVEGSPGGRPTRVGRSRRACGTGGVLRLPMPVLRKVQPATSNLNSSIAPSTRAGSASSGATSRSSARSRCRQHVRDRRRPNRASSWGVQQRRLCGRARADEGEPDRRGLDRLPPGRPVSLDIDKFTAAMRRKRLRRRDQLPIWPRARGSASPAPRHS